MDLLDTLRKRSERRTETVDCGGLGGVTVQALPLRDCAALSAGADGNRAVLFAACRDLQAAGELLRSEGTLFTPEEIMQYISDEEAGKGAETVRRISGLPDTPEGRRETRQDLEDRNSETPQKTAGKQERQTAGKLRSMEGPALKTDGTDPEILHPIPAEKKQTEQMTHAPFLYTEHENRALNKHSQLKKTDIQPQNAGVSPLMPPKDMGHHSSNEKRAAQKQTKKFPQSFAPPSAQHPAKDFTGQGQEHKAENDGETLRRLMSDFGENKEEMPCEIQSKFDEETADFDERAAWALLEGLLRAAGAR